MGIDLHKETHTAVMLDCWNQKLGEITFENKPSEFSKLTRKVSRFVTEEKEPVYGLENAYGYGRALAVWLIEKGVAVKDVNTALSYAQRKSVPMYQKSDSYDAEAVALVLINMLDKLPDAIPDDKYWTLSQLVNRRDNICTHLHCLKNQLHEQLCIAYPSYKQFFSDISRATALYFFMEYPSPEHLPGKKAEELAALTKINATMERSVKNGYQNPPASGTLPFGTYKCVLDEKDWIESVPFPADMERVEKEIIEAKKQADIVLVSFHGHETDGEDTTVPSMFLETFSRRCVDAGADAVIGHGPHELRGIEIYHGAPIFYSLGNFLFETETVEKQPYDAYINKKMPLDTKVGAYMDARSKNGTAGYGVLPEIWLSVMAGWTMEDGHLTEIKLYPISLGMTEKRPQKGVPVLTGDEKVLAYLAGRSKPYGTEMEIKDGVGTIRL